MFCMNCGDENDDKAVFCMNCGMKLPQMFNGNNDVGNNTMNNEFNSNDLNNNYINNSYANNNSYVNNSYVNNDSYVNNSYINNGFINNELNSDVRRRTQIDNNIMINSLDNGEKNKNGVLNIIILLMSIVGCVSIFLDLFILKYEWNAWDFKYVKKYGINIIDLIFGRSRFEDFSAVRIFALISLIIIHMIVSLEIILLLVARDNTAYRCVIVTSLLNVIIISALYIIYYIKMNQDKDIVKYFELSLGVGFIVLLSVQFIKVILLIIAMNRNSNKGRRFY